MTDDRLRETERVFRETGSVEDEARLLTERVRAGQLAPERLELAAELRYEPAALATGGHRGASVHSYSGILESLERFGQAVVVRAALIAARRTLDQVPPHALSEGCLAAAEAWLACPCERHAREAGAFAVANAYGDALYAALLAAGGTSVAELRETRRFVFGRRDDEAVLVAAIRRTLLLWALAPRAPSETRAPGRGSVLHLTIGSGRASETQRVVIATDQVRIGQRPRDGIQLAPHSSAAECELVRKQGGFELHVVGGPGRVFVNDEQLGGRDLPLASRRLATGDVLSFGSVWADVRILDARMDEEVERAIHEAPRLHARSNDPGRVALAAALGQLAATVAATEARIGFLPMLDLESWLATVNGLPGLAAPVAALRLAREVLPVLRAVRDVRESCERAVEAVAGWLAAPALAARFDSLALERDILSGLDRTPHALKTAEIRAAGTAVRSCLVSLRDWKGLRGAARSAVSAGVPPERVRTFVSEALGRWALGE